ncbi:hypothetical protein [Arthrobacter sp. StoSoilA2]|uniref:hypothetical protein n=1 Tax=Arthrobacter sp. StoSoilA2 TaxID=2830990 RepID=UPI001CC45AA8|nr:hypothetical protein [Arthrobacter sp. StoSoilA2]
MGSFLGLIAVVDAGLGHGESILIFLGLAAFLTGLYSLIFKRRSWAALPGRTAAICMTTAGISAALLGGIAAGVDGSRKAEAAAQPTTAIELEADVSAKVAQREENVRKAEEALKAREEAVAAAEGGAEANTIKEGIWTVGKDIVPGVYRTTQEVSDSCSWVITRTGSNGSDYIDHDFYVKGGFPMVTLAAGQTFDTEGCGNWAKQ